MDRESQIDSKTENAERHANSLPEQLDSAGLRPAAFQGGVDAKRFHDLSYLNGYIDRGHKIAERKEQLADQNEQASVAGVAYTAALAIEEMRQGYESSDDISHPNKPSAWSIVNKVTEVITLDYLVRDEDNNNDYEQAA
ncbi:hypothetical protein FWF48_02210 [Candidatus Saccharibacteria bacterium]|nr:hypothetical protein [Candidatus Saccharibacteria bacterium]